MRELANYRTNVGQEPNPSSLLAQGDDPVLFKTQDVRASYMESDAAVNGSIEKGVSMEHDLYVTNPDNHEGGSHYA